jgi:hypothetical protein
MPFGKKPDLAGGVVIDFDVIYELAIRPAISEAGLEPIRGDKERTGGIIQCANVCANTIGRIHGSRPYPWQPERLL